MSHFHRLLLRRRRRIEQGRRAVIVAGCGHPFAVPAVVPDREELVAAAKPGLLDPHITQRNALSVYQLDRVAMARAGNGDVVKVRDGISRLVKDLSFTPLSGLVGEPLVNVLELNLALDEKFPLAVVAKLP